jgi:DNA polymerase I
MELLRGQPATEALCRLLGLSGVPAVDVDPGARRGERATVVAVATPEETIFIDVNGSPEAGVLLAGATKPMGGEEAKAVHRALVTTFGIGPGRWACTKLSAQLLAAGREADLSLVGSAAHVGLPAPADATLGLEAWGARVRSVARVIERLIPELKTAEMGWVSRIEAAAVAPIVEMEQAGMPFDATMWQQLTDEAEVERKALQTTIHQHFSTVRDADLFGGAVLNLDSDQDLKAALHALGHLVPDVRRETVAALPAPIGRDLSRYRELFKIVSAYGESFLTHVAGDGRVHPVFEQIGASTGRLSCHSPNLQAVVKGTPHRGCFHTGTGRLLVIGDYSACELRILAEMSGDPVFAEAFGRGEDLHARVASEVFGKKVSKTENPDLRERAKAINFGLAYGMGAGGLARTTGSSVTQARELFERYFKTFPKIRTFLEHSAADALARGYARTMTGRRLYLNVGDDRDQRAQAERIAKNMPIQGTSADITKLALARLRKKLTSFHSAAIVNTVHDEIVIECDEVEADSMKDALGEEMRQAGAEVLHTIPVGVDVTISTKWDK